MSGISPSGPPRDFVGYGRNPPKVRWPDGSALAVNIVLNYEEGAEYSLLDGDPIQDTWGETTTPVPPPVRDMGTETHYEFGSRVGVWRIVRLVEEFGIPISVDAPGARARAKPAVRAVAARRRRRRDRPRVSLD